MEKKTVNTAARPKKPDPIDVHVGSRIRLRRNMLGMSQGTLGHGLGITFQQVQKYEKGANRVGASRLNNIALILDVPIAYFFDGGAKDTTDGRSGDEANELATFLSTAEGLQLNRAFARIDDAKVRSRIIGLVKTLADGK